MKIILTIILSLSFAYAYEGTVVKKEFNLIDFKTVSGKNISNLKVGFESYGTLNESKSNAILITHFFTGTSHAAGKYQESDTVPGYWDSIIGPGKALDTNKYFIISSDTLVNLTPADKNTITTGPYSLNPKTRKAYGMSFPEVTARDFVNVQRKLLDSLGIKKLVAVMGPSGGAAQAVEWAVAYPNDVAKVIAVIGPGLSLPSYTVALLDFWINPIKLDPRWKNGNYKTSEEPLKGLVESLKLITFTAGSFESMEAIGRDNVQAFLEKRATDRAKAIDANSVIYMAKAMQSFDVEDEAANIQAKILFIPSEKDMIFEPRESIKAVKKLCSLGKSADYAVMKTNGGHIDGVTKIALMENDIASFLAVGESAKWGCTK